MEVKARAPGKIILAGEHAVVHGSTAVAASVDLYTTASVRLPSSSDENDIVKLQLKDLKLEFSWPLSRIREALGVFVGAISSPTTCLAECLKSIASLVEDQNIPEVNIGLASGVAAFLWLCSSILGLHFTVSAPLCFKFVPVEVAITSELPLGSGLGSSAAFCVALSAALLALSGSVNVDREHHGWMVYKEDELDLLNKWAFEGEKIIHGKPSGIDNTGSTYEQLNLGKCKEMAKKSEERLNFVEQEILETRTEMKKLPAMEENMSLISKSIENINVQMEKQQLQQQTIL
ncbi:hypothetical protein IC582_011651 [Cucumis melo]